MCRDRSHGGRRCACDTSAARQARRAHARAQASPTATAARQAAAATTAPTPPEPTPEAPTAESLSAQAQDLHVRVATQTLDYDTGAILTDETMERMRAMEEQSTALGTQVDSWIESQDDVVEARGRWEDSVGLYEAAKERNDLALKDASEKRAAAFTRGLSVQERREATDAAYAAQNEARRTNQEALDAYQRVVERADTLGQARLAHFGTLRLMGGDLDVQGTKGGAPTKRIREAMADTSRYFPTDWAASSNSIGSGEEGSPLYVRASKRRSHYERGARYTRRRVNRYADEHAPDWVPGQPSGTYATYDDDGTKHAVEYLRHGGTVTVAPHREAFNNNRRDNVRTPTLVERTVIREDGTLTPFGQDDGWATTTLPDGTVGATRSAADHQGVLCDKGGILTAGFTSPTADNVSVHETTHRMECALPHLGALERAYLTRRTGTDPRGVTRRGMTTLYEGRREKAVTGGVPFYNDYVGKVYEDDQNYEVASMGTPLAFGKLSGPNLTNEIKGMRDSDHRSFIYGAMLTV